MLDGWYSVFGFESLTLFSPNIMSVWTNNSAFVSSERFWLVHVKSWKFKFSLNVLQRFLFDLSQSAVM